MDRKNKQHRLKKRTKKTNGENIMKKFALAFAIVATLVVALLSTGNVFAQGTTPPAPQTPGSGYGRGGAMGNGGGMMGGRGMMSGNVAAGEGILHDGMIAVFAEKL